MQENDKLKLIVFILLIILLILVIYRYTKQTNDEFEPEPEPEPTPEPLTCDLTPSAIQYETSEDLTSYWDGGVQSNGKIIAGHIRYLIRYNLDGTIDTNFGDNGLINISDATSYTIRNIFCIRVGLDDSIYVSVSGRFGGDNDSGIVKFTQDGELDQTFGTSGVFIRTEEMFNDISYTDVVDFFLHSTGIYVLTHKRVLFKLTYSGEVDQVFDYIDIKYDDSSIPLIKLDIYDNKIFILAGEDDTGESNSIAVVFSYNIDGTVNSSYGTAGQFVLDITSLGYNCEALYPCGGGIDKDGNFYAIMQITLDDSSSCSNYHIAVFKIKLDGSLDTTFGSEANGAYIDKRPDYFQSGDWVYGNQNITPVFATDGNLNIALTRYKNSDGTTNWYLLVLTSDGVPLDGPSPLTEEDQKYAMRTIPHHDGKIIVLGEVNTINPARIWEYDCQMITYSAQTRPW